MDEQAGYCIELSDVTVEVLPTENTATLCLAMAGPYQTDKTPFQPYYYMAISHTDEGLECAEQSLFRLLQEHGVKVGKDHPLWTGNFRLHFGLRYRKRPIYNGLPLNETLLEPFVELINHYLSSVRPQAIRNGYTIEGEDWIRPVVCHMDHKLQKAIYN